MTLIRLKSSGCLEIFVNVYRMTSAANALVVMVNEEVNIPPKRRRKHRNSSLTSTSSYSLTSDQEAVFGTLLESFTTQLRDATSMLQDEYASLCTTNSTSTSNKRKRHHCHLTSRIMVKQYLSKNDLHTRPKLRTLVEECLSQFQQPQQQQQDETKRIRTSDTNDVLSQIEEVHDSSSSPHRQAYPLQLDSGALDVLRKSSYRYLNRILHGACDQAEQSHRVTVNPGDIQHFIALENRQTMAFQQEERELQADIL